MRPETPGAAQKAPPNGSRCVTPALNRAEGRTNHAITLARHIRRRVVQRFPSCQVPDDCLLFCRRPLLVSRDVIRAVLAEFEHWG